MSEEMDFAKPILAKWRAEPVNGHTYPGAPYIYTGELPPIEHEVAIGAIDKLSAVSADNAALRAEVDELRAQRTIAEFIAEVNRRAEATMATGMVSGAHWNAMRSVAGEWGITAHAPQEVAK